MMAMSEPGMQNESASIDMSQFFQVFFEEAEEHLTEMESLLLSIDPAAATGEELNAIFRAAHSIKGGSGTFGFTDMTAVTHELESLLDRVRKHEIALTPEMVDALLVAGDVLKGQLAHHRGHADETPDAEGICERIRDLLRGESAAAPVAVADQPAACPQRTQRTLRVTFRAADGAAIEQAALDDLLALVRDLGEPLSQFEADAGEYAIQLRTRAADKEVRNLFALLCAPDAIRIEVVDVLDAAVPVAVEAAQPATEDAYGFFDGAPGAIASSPATDKAATEDAAWGLFDDAPGTPAAASTPQVAAPTVAHAPHGRRASDQPDGEGVRAGRRDTDKTVQHVQGDAASIRVSVDKVDQLINQVGELVITQAMLAEAVSRLDPLLHENLCAGMADLERNTRDLQETVMSIRMMPIGFVFKRFPRMVRDLAAKLGKQVQLVTEGEATELDKGLIEQIADPLTHLVRNSVDHGIEMPEARLAAGKRAQGSVTLRAAHQGGSILVEVIDDGHGLDRERILAKARERGLPVDDAMSDGDVWQLIFEAGFSTAATVTDISGRGVGMDVVKRNIADLGGSVEIESAKGLGTRMMVRLPLTLAIIDGMLVAVGDDVYIIPLAMVIESLQAGERATRPVAGDGCVIEVRNEYLPVISLHKVFPGGGKRLGGCEGIMVVVESGGVKNALLVDELLGQQQVVVKNIEANYRKVPGVAAATILGDGRVAFILDVPSLVRMGRH